MTAAPHRIDTHHHLMPSFYVDAAARHGITTAGDIPLPRWTVESALALMDRSGIATGVGSIAAPGVHFGDRAEARALARRCNEFAARLVADHPQRFGSFAVLPLPDVELALEEVAYAFDTLHADGVVLLASYDEHYLGDPRFEPLFAELDRRKAVVFVHPTIPVSSHALKLAMPGAMIEFVFDTTRAVANLIYSGTLERYRNLSIILAHAGGTVPFVSWRIAQGDRIPALLEKAPRGAVAYLERLYYDTAMSANRHALASLHELVDPSHIVFGSDTPFLPEPLIQECERGLAAYAPFDAATRAGIERDNALALFPRLRERAQSQTKVTA